MPTIVLVSAIVSAALVAGALYGLYGRLSDRAEGFIVAVAGGSLVLSLVTELIEPAIERTSLWLCILAVAAGAGVFTIVDWLIDEKMDNSRGGGLLAAITLDGIPENLALGVALIGAGPMQVLALAGSIFLSNLPEAAGGAKRMAEGGRSRGRILWLWTGTALMLAIAAIAGNILLADVSPHLLSLLRCFAAGAVVASLATEVFPLAFREDHQLAGFATALGLMLSLVLAELGNG